MLYHGHFVLSQCASLVGADHLGTAQGLHSGQTADHRIAFGHFGYTDGQNHRNHCSQALGDGCHCQRNSDHKGFQNTGDGIILLHHQVKNEDKYTDAQHQPAQGLAQLIQLTLQRGLLILCLCQHTGNFTHLGIHTGFGNDSLATAIDHSRTHVAHVLPVTQRHIRILFNTQYLNVLIYRHRFTGQRSFFNFQRSTFKDSAVRRHCIACLQHDHIAGDQLGRMQHDLLTVADHLTGGSGHGLQRFNGRLCFTLLDHAQNGIEEHHDHNDANLHQALS